MGLIFERHETERLENASLPFSHWVKHFGHPVHTAGLGMKRDLDEIARRESARELQQSAVDRHDVDVPLGPLAVAKLNDDWCGC